MLKPSRAVLELATAPADCRDRHSDLIAYLSLAMAGGQESHDGPPLPEGFDFCRCQQVVKEPRNLACVMERG
jgi:hypothetical protein